MQSTPGLNWHVGKAVNFFQLQTGAIEDSHDDTPRFRAQIDSGKLLFWHEKNVV